MKKIFAAIAALLVSWALGSGLATATPMPTSSSLYEVTMSGPDASWDAANSTFNLGGLYDTSSSKFWGAGQKIGERKLTFNFLTDVNVSLDFLFSTADSKPWDVGNVSFNGTSSFNKSFAGKSWTNMTLEYFDFSRTFTANAGNSLDISLGTWGDKHFMSWIDGNISVTAADTGSAPVPEPATMLLFGTGIIGLAGNRIRRQKKQKA